LYSAQHVAVPEAPAAALPPVLEITPLLAAPKASIVTVASAVPAGADSAFAFTLPV
jgi:hypothetical protein